MEYKKSVYNLLIDEKYLWNTMTGAFAMLTSEELAYYNAFSGNNDGSKLFSEFENNSYFVAKEVNELDELLKKERQIFLDEEPSQLYYVIAPTLKCNYACEYCFESNRDIRSDMNEAVISDVLAFIDSNLTNNMNAKQLHITFFGGEPLLRLDIVDRLSRGIYEICSRYKVEYRPVIISNGRFLNENALSIFKRDQFRSVQISLDCVGEKYNSVKGASPSDFDKTINNILEASKELKRIVVRVNVRDNDFSDAHRIADYLFSGNPNNSLRMYLANVNEGKKDQRTQKYIEFVDGEAEFIHWISKQYGDNRYFYKRPLRKGVSCRLSCDRNFCIGPEGELYKCEYHFGQSKYIVGNVKTGFDKKIQEWYHNLARHGDEFNNCLSCNILPICMGGCINNKIQGEKIFDCKKFTERMIMRQMKSYAARIRDLT